MYSGKIAVPPGGGGIVITGAYLLLEKVKCQQQVSVLFGLEVIVVVSGFENSLF
jgi:hypothetical protein